MRFGFDLHGVLSDKPEVFKVLLRSLVHFGCEVHIITGSRKAAAVEELKKLGFRPAAQGCGEHGEYTNLFSIADYHYEKGTPMTIDIHGNPHMAEEAWNVTKARYCKDNTIDLHFDDSDIYGKHFVTPYARIYTKDRDYSRKEKA